MADFEAPSFSLGLDFDLLDSEPQTANASEDNKDRFAPNRSSVAAPTPKNDDDFENPTVVDSVYENQGLPPKLKRLRRGPTVEDIVSPTSTKSSADLHSVVVVDDDDIEEFSSPECNRTDGHLSTQHHSVCNSSKFPLNAHGFVTKQAGKRKQNASNGPESVITTCNKPPFPKLTISPLRRFQLIDSDSDSDDPSISEGANKKTFNGPESYINRGQPRIVQDAGLTDHGKLNESINTSTRKDMWEDFRLEESFHIPTPALDEVCEEYFRSIKDKSKTQSNNGKSNQNSHVTNTIINLGDPLPPAHQYFFHDDLRVQELVRTRLPNFFPLNAANRNSEQPSTSNIDYIGQFSHGTNSKQAATTNKAETSSRKISRKSKTQETSQGSMNQQPITQKGIPKDAGKRRVQAYGQPGHWFTNSDGKRVYVSKNGQELTGRGAYMLYRKESGAGFKSKKAKKVSTKKK